MPYTQNRCSFVEVKAFADWLRGEMARRAWTQRDLAHHSEVSLGIIQKLLTGEYPDATRGTIALLAATFGVDREDLKALYRGQRVALRSAVAPLGSAADRMAELLRETADNPADRREILLLALDATKRELLDLIPAEAPRGVQIVHGSPATPRPAPQPGQPATRRGR